MSINVFTADSLIEAFGDQAYHKGLRMACEALQADDRGACRSLCQANLELMHRGYHKKPKENDDHAH
jgi:hypothetical protein